MLNLYNANSHNQEKLENNLTETASNQAKKFIKYVDPTGEFTGKELKWSMWLERNKLLLHRLVVWALIIISVVFWGTSLWKWGDYLIFGLTETARLEQLSTSFFDYTVSYPHLAANPVQVLGVTTFANGTGKIDAVAEATNPNSKFIVYFDYYFIFGENKTPKQRGFLLAGETKPIVNLGLDSAVYYGTGNFIMDNIAWQRVDNHQIKDAMVWQQERLNFSIADFKYVSRGSMEAGDSSAVQFVLTNDSAYGYVDAKFLAGLYQGGALVGVLPFDIEKFISGQAEALDLRTFSPNLSVSEVKIFPLIDLYDQKVYTQPEK